MTRIILVHRWGGSPSVDWYPWLKEEVENRKAFFAAPAMPNPHNPQIKPWVSTLGKWARHLNEDTYLVGHSIGCQTILRFLEQLPKEIEVGGVALVAPWTKLKLQSYEKPGDKDIAKPWIETPIQWDKIVARDHNTTCIFSDDDPYVPIEEAEFFREKLNADIILEEGKGHFTEYDDMKAFPSLLHVLEKWGIFPEKNDPLRHDGISRG